MGSKAKAQVSRWERRSSDGFDEFVAEVADDLVRLAYQLTWDLRVVQAATALAA